MISEARPSGRLGPWVLVVGVLGVVPTGAAPLAAQVVEEPVDSARIRILDRLTRLAKPPGVDSTLFRDSLSGREPPRAPRPGIREHSPNGGVTGSCGGAPLGQAAGFPARRLVVLSRT